MTVLIIASILLLIIQILLGVYSLIIRADIIKKFNHPLGSMVTPAEALEKYSKIIQKISVRVNAEIELPAYAGNEIILVNKSKVYQTDLFSNFFTLFQVELSKKKQSIIRDFGLIINFIFIVQLVSIIFSFIFINNQLVFIPIISIGSSIILFFLSIVFFFSLETVLKKALFVSKDLLDLDPVEYARAEALSGLLRFEAFEYPIRLLRNLIGFVIP
jgi:hypothetical protein